jgi:hypothetical protein
MVIQNGQFMPEVVDEQQERNVNEMSQKGTYTISDSYIY